MSASPTNVAVMIGGLGVGGSERQLYMFLARCDRRRWNPVLYASGELGYWEGPIRELGVPITLLAGNPLVKLHQFRSAVVAQHATCFFSWSSYTNGFALALAGINSVRIGSFRNAGFSDLPHRMHLVWRWVSIQGISIAVCNSHETQAAIARMSKLKSLYVPNAVEVFSQNRVQAYRQQWRDSLGIDANAILVVGAGRLAPQKNFSRFISTIAVVARASPIQAVIAGDDRGCLPALEAQIARMGLQDSVRLIGSVPDARELICAADIYLLSSDHEGMPNVILEAMAAGVPCVTTKVNSATDLIQPGVTGFLANFDAVELARYVGVLAADASLRAEIGSRARSVVERIHQPEPIIDRLWSLCDGANPVQTSNIKCD